MWNYYRTYNEIIITNIIIITTKIFTLLLPFELNVTLYFIPNGHCKCSVSLFNCIRNTISTNKAFNMKNLDKYASREFISS